MKLKRPWWDQKAADHQQLNRGEAWHYTQATSHRRKSSHKRRPPKKG
jgi:hypothetical protein